MSSSNISGKHIYENSFQNVQKYVVFLDQSCEEESNNEVSEDEEFHYNANRYFFSSAKDSNNKKTDLLS